MSKFPFLAQSEDVNQTKIRKREKNSERTVKEQVAD